MNIEQNVAEESNYFNAAILFQCSFQIPFPERMCSLLEELLHALAWNIHSYTEWYLHF
jgi:hypothetical protein